MMLTGSCKHQKTEIKPVHLIGKDTMVKVLADIHLLEASLGIKVFEEKKMDHTRNLIKEKIYGNYAVSKKQFFDSYNYYSQHSAQLDSIYTDVITEISKRQSELKKSNPKTNTARQ
jgi:hypothetical protein